jgi:hypothetical protein
MWDGGTVIARDGGGCRIRWGRHATVGKGVVSGWREWHGCLIRWERHVVVGEGMQSREEKATGEEGNARAPWHQGEGGCGHHAEGRERGEAIAASGRRDNRGADTGSARGLGRIVRGGGGGQNLAPLVLWTSTLLSYRVEEMWDSVSVVLPPSRSL